MCYAFTDKIEEQAGFVNEATYCFDRQELSACSANDNAELKATSLKRPAEGNLEQEQVKRAKHSNDVDGEHELDQSKEADDLRRSLEEITTLKKSLKQANVRIKQLEKDNEALEEKNDDLNFNIAEYELKENKYKEKVKAERDDARAAGKQSAQKAKLECATRLEKMKVQHQKKIESLKEEKDDKIEDLRDKHEADLLKKDDAWRKKVDELKAKNQQLEKDMKKSKAEHAEAEKELKAEHQRIQKELKSEQQEKIKEWKPEHSKTVKEKETQLKDTQNQVSSLEQERDKLKKKIQTLDTAFNHLQAKEAKLEADAKEKNAAIETLQNESNTQKEQLEQLAEDSKGIIKSCNDKLEREGQRWQGQKDKADAYARAYTEQQRINFVLRGTLNTSTEQVKDLKIELQAERERISKMLKGDVTTSDALVQTGEEAQLGGEGMEAKNLADEPAAISMLDDGTGPPPEVTSSTEVQGEEA